MKNHKLLTKIISKAQTDFIVEDNRRKAFDNLLADILQLTDSEYGFIGEVLHDGEQQPFLKAYALTNIAWNDETRSFYQEHAPDGLEFRNLSTLFGYTLRTGLKVIANEPASHPEAGGLPIGHPPLNAYLGLPVVYNEQLIAMLGIANKPSGYHESDVSFLQPLLKTIGQLVYATRVKRAETILQQQLNNTVEASQLGIWTLDLNTNVLEVNDRWLSMLGYGSDDIYPITTDWMRQQMHPDDLSQSRNSMQRHLQGEDEFYQSQFRIRHRNGSWIWIQARGRLLAKTPSVKSVENGFVYGINIDITEQKNIEYKLTKLAEHVPGLVYQFQRFKDGTITFPYAGPASEKILGFTPEQLRADGAQVFSRIHPEDLTMLQDSIDQSARELRVWKQSFRLSLNGQHYRWLLGQSSPEPMPDDSVLWHGYIQDVTDEVMLQHELKQAKVQAELAVATKSGFLANMSHEIRTPMNGIIGMLDVMADSNTDPTQAENISLMRDSAYSLLTIIDDILDFSKLEAGKLSLVPKAVNLAETIDKICSMVDFLAIKSRVTFYYYVDTEIPPQVMVDSDRLRQVLINLLSNAIKFSSKTPRHGEVYLKVTLQDQQDNNLLVEFSVEDNGIGMSADVVQGLFQPFTQADASTSRKYGGTGLGLAITQQLTHLMAGVISAQSQLEQGSIFTLMLPLTSAGTGIVAERKMAGVNVIVLIPPTVRYMQYLAKYLEAEGAMVSWLTLQQITLQQTQPSNERILWICDSNDETHTNTDPQTYLQQHYPLQSRFLILGCGRRRKARRMANNAVYIDVNALSRKQFIHAAYTAYFDVELVIEAKPQHVNLETTPPQFKILVLEDNTTNQKVIRQQLHRLGYQVTIADNGQAGLHLASKQHFDLILSDLHMPVLDGYDFIQQFRDVETKSGYPRTPVIALTANIIQEELHRAKALGMDDYLVKPLPAVQLKHMLEKYLPSKTGLTNTDALTTVTAAGSASTLTAPNAVLFKPDAIADMVGEDAVQEILLDYQCSLTHSRNLIADAFVKQEWSIIRREAHKLKSSSRFIGCDELANVFSALEDACKKSLIDVDYLHLQLDAIQDLALILNGQIQAFCAQS